MSAYVVENDHGCGFFGGILHFNSIWNRKSSTHMLPSSLNHSPSKPLKKPTMLSPRPLVSHGRQDCVKRGSVDVARSSSSSSPRPTKVQNKQLALYQSRQRTMGHGAQMGNILRKSSTINSNNMMKIQDGERLKLMGNDKYKKGKYEEALALYDQAISLDPNQASYRGNRGAALMCLGRILEAVFECREALRIQPCYHRAHHRLATLYIRLGYAESAVYHLRCSGSLASHRETVQAQALETCLRRCAEAKKSGEWSVVLKETMWAISAGADSAPQVYGLQVEALLNLLRHEEAYAAYKKSPNFNMDHYAKLFSECDAIALYMIRARVYLAAGRFEDAIKAGEYVVKLNPGNKDAKTVLIRAKCIAMARERGNNNFHESRFTEACTAYSEGLEVDPYNAVLLCNRAACRAKLGEYEKAIEDCSLALRLRPSYNKARLRRAACNAKLGRWEAAMGDYEVLMRETAGNSEEVGKGMFECQLQLKKQTRRQGQQGLLDEGSKSPKNLEVSLN